MDKLQALEWERRQLLDEWRDEKQLLNAEYKSKLDAISKQIKSQKHVFANSKARKVKSVLKNIR